MGCLCGYEQISLQKEYPFLDLQADRGCATVASFFGGGGGLLAKKGVTLRGLRISEKKEILRKPIVSVLIHSKLCTIQYCNITILLQYCTIL
jgi:hypothetical protein